MDEKAMPILASNDRTCLDTYQCQPRTDSRKRDNLSETGSLQKVTHS